ncbi:MAG: hypothetical protein IT385_10975 [Deltaproteobacteria bacterium]|nr:hypothetical protein [Deltaproteobacteria bacterium]
MRPSLAIAWCTIASACSPGTEGRTDAADIGTDADTVFVPPDALFPTDTGDASGATTDGATTDATPPDTTIATDTTAATDTSIVEDTSACPTGAGCNDGDPCTINDRCEDGRCVGGRATCDDGLPCTTDVCTGGVCSVSVQSGSCAIDGACYSAEQPNPADACARCEPSAADDAWSDIPDCGLGLPCDYHTDCYPERVCATWSKTGVAVCSDPCAGAADCPSGQICSKLPGSAQVGFCEQPVPATLADGAACTDDAQCRSGLCGGTCAPLCLDEAHCAIAGHTCHAAGDLAAGLLVSMCSPDPQGAIGLGQVCSPDGGANFDGSLCASGHCDLTMFETSTSLPCAPICKSELDCAPAQECNLVLYATARSPRALPYDPLFTERTYDALTACYNPGQFGAKQVGAPCTDRAQCGSNKCLGLIPGDPTTYCTSFCEHDAECPSGMACKLEAITLGSTWLATYPVISGQPQNGNGWTFVRVCKFE